MQFISYHSDGLLRPGVVVDGRVYSLMVLAAAARLDSPYSTTSLRAFLEVHGANLQTVIGQLNAKIIEGAVSPVATYESLRLGPPIADPAKVLCVGLNYSDHVGETGRAMPEYPDLFAKFATSLIGPYDVIDRSEVTSNLDYEGELAIVIGKTATRVEEADALSCVAGLSVLNDITARDLQYRGTQWLAGKAVDRATPFGPALVTLDEVGDPQALDIETYVNGNRVQGSNTRYMIFPIAKIVSYISQFLTLQPGDVIATGTPEGIGAKKNPPVWLQPGDKVEVRLANVGVLRNEIV